MSGKDGEILPPTVRQPQSLRLSTVKPPYVGGLLSKWQYHFQTLTVRKQEELFDALVDLSAAQQRAVKAKLALEITLVSLEFLEDYKEAERERIRAELKINSDKLLSDLLKSGVDLNDVMAAARKSMNPPPPPEKKERRDPMLDRMEATLRGGKYAKQAEAMIDDLIKERGGEDKLTEEDQERIRNLWRLAAQGDEGQG